MAGEPPVTLPRTAWWDMQAGKDPGHVHRILLAWPEGEPPPGGLPVLFLADGNATFATAVEAARTRARLWRDAAADVAPAVIVGLGHPGPGPYDRAARSRDYTPRADAAPEGTGGADAFLDFITDTLLPELERRLPLDRARMALFGHSLGGLLALHALFTRPALFRRIVAASPSLWWADGAPMAMAERFAASPPPEAKGTGLHVMVGGLEETDDGTPRGARRAERRMVTRARDLAALLRGRISPLGFVEFAGENHGSVVPAAISRALPFALPPDPERPA